MCGAQLADGVSAKKLMIRLALDSTIIEVVRQGSLRWLGHMVKGVTIVLNRRGGLRLKEEAKVSLENYDGKPLS